MIFKSLINSLFIATLCLLLQGCIKEDLSKISSDYEWNGKISLPLSSKKITADNYVGILGLVDDYINSGGWGVVHTTTADFNFSDRYPHPEYIDSIMLRFEITNNFPGKLEKMTMLFLDESESSTIPALSDLPLEMEAPTLNEAGDITSKSYLLIDQWFSKEDIPSLIDTKFVYVRVLIKEIDLREVVRERMDEYSIDVNIALRSVETVPVEEL
ncbi:hypothetical protein [Saccharicrinis sp. GN24d3]|uniref:hypothetical protein n=1 Tax=Saccharicrinis sp. GN24d3 TaxID=3458416 RepID=UPI00403681DD